MSFSSMESFGSLRKARGPFAPGDEVRWPDAA